MQGFYPHVYLSPHLDDAVLSCGGIIHRQVVNGQRPLIITLFAGQPAAGVSLSDFARSLHVLWGNLPDVVSTRWAEDQAALSQLGADYLRLDYLDCIYRGRPQAGEWYYTSEGALFGQVHPAEEKLPLELAAALAELIPAAADVTLYAPLTVGDHVDHQLTLAAAMILKSQGWRLRLYEDYPYVGVEGALGKALVARGVDDWHMVAVPLTEEDIAARIEAIACYPSQLEVLFGGAEAMPQRVRDYVTRVGGERWWQLD